jgi:hypothetical protein
MDELELRDTIERIMWGETVLGIDMWKILKSADCEVMAELLLKIFRAFGQDEVISARSDIDKYLTDTAQKYFKELK